MLGSRNAPAFFLVVTAATLSMAHAALGAPAADACRTKPGAPAPPGTHWFYRISHADSRHCWYLSAASLRVRPHGPEATARLAAADSPPQPNDDGGAGQQATPPQTVPQAVPPLWAAMPLMPDLSAASTPLDFTARWSDLPKHQEAESAMASAPGASPGTEDASAYVVEQTPLIRPLRAAAAAKPQGDATVAASIGPVIAAAALVMVSLLLAGAGLARRSDRGAATPTRLSQAQRAYFAGMPSDVRTTQAADARVQRLPTPTDPERDIKTSLRELMDDLRRADAADKASRSVLQGPSEKAREKSAREVAKAARVAARTTPLLELSDHNRSIWRAAQSRSGKLISELS